MSAACPTQQIGLYGGTFDPVHRGHLAIAEQVLAQYQLDTLLLIPAARPPHKEQPQAAYLDRVAMLRAALAALSGRAEQKRLEISLIEAQREAPSYTFDTCLALRQRLGPQKFFLIIGADSFCELHLWYRYRELLALVDLIVAARPAFAFELLARQIVRLPGNYRYDERERLWRTTTGRCIYYFPNPHEQVSSSEIRAKLRAGQPVTHLLPSAVEEYIHHHQLYLPSQPAGIRGRPRKI